MKLSTKIRYGLRAILQIAVEGEKTPLMARKIAEKQGISEPYIDQLLIPLRTNGLIRSFRGRRGGYQMAVKPRELTILDIVEALDGKLSIIDCLEDDKCKKATTCAARVVWEKVDKTLRKTLSSMTLEDLREIEVNLEQTHDFVI